MVAPSPLELRRRSTAERRTLELLRGGRMMSVAMKVQSSPNDRPFRTVGDERRKRFRELALIAVRHGFAIQPPRAAYVHLDELRLLHLIADAQAGKLDGDMNEPLKVAILEAAAMLKTLGIDLLGALRERS